MHAGRRGENIKLGTLATGKWLTATWKPAAKGTCSSTVTAKVGGSAATPGTATIKVR